MARPPKVPYIASDLSISVVVFPEEEREYEGQFGRFTWTIPPEAGGDTAPRPGGEWMATGVLAIQDGQLVIESLEIKPALSTVRPIGSARQIPSKGVTTALLRLPLRKILARAMEMVVEAESLPLNDEQAVLAGAAHRALVELPNEGRRTGNRELGDEMYARTALAYLQAVQAGTKDVTGAVAEALGVSRTQAQARKREARRRDFLAKGSSGRAGGTPTPRLVEWLREH